MPKKIFQMDFYDSLYQITRTMSLFFHSLLVLLPEDQSYTQCLILLTISSQFWCKIASLPFKQFLPYCFSCPVLQFKKKIFFYIKHFFEVESMRIMQQIILNGFEEHYESFSLDNVQVLSYDGEKKISNLLPSSFQMFSESSMFMSVTIPYSTTRNEGASVPDATSGWPCPPQKDSTSLHRNNLPPLHSGDSVPPSINEQLCKYS